MPDEPPQSSLISAHPSTSGLQIALHPLALLTISDYITRHVLRNQPGPIVGALLGTQSGREIAIEHAYEVLLLGEGDEIQVEPQWFEQKLKLFQETHPTTYLLGWFTTTSDINFTPTPAHATMHQQLLVHNESLILLLMNPSPAASVGAGGKLPLAIYESTYESDESEQQAQGTLRLKFIPLKYTIETGEAEMIGVDFVAKGGFGNASEEASGLEGSSKGEKSNGSEQKNGKGKEKAVEKEKDKGDAETVNVGSQNDELLANLTAKRNAILMLHSRIRLLLSYLSSPPSAEPNHQILRALWSLTHSRLPLLTPANADAFTEEKLAEESDVNLVVLLGTLTKSLEEVRSVGRKFAAIESMVKARGPPQGEFGDIGGHWDPSPREGRRRGLGGGMKGFHAPQMYYQ